MSGPVEAARERIGLGIASIIVGVACMAIMDAFAKWLGAGYPIAEVIFFRGLFALPLMLALAWRGGATGLRVGWPLGHVLRTAFALGATFPFFYGLRFLPLAEAISIAFAAPLFVTALSVPVLGERVGWRRWAAVVIGFVGVLVMTRPGGAAFRPEALLILAAALCYASAMLVTRRLSRTDTTAAILIYGTLGTVLVSALLLPFGWRAPDPADLGLFVAMGLEWGAMMYFMTQAYRHAPAAVVAPFDFTALVWGALIGWIVWRELPDAYVWVGAAIVVTSGLYIIRRETGGAD
jgi:drug/metabolite transporter (DMT)-like permease